MLIEVFSSWSNAFPMLKLPEKEHYVRGKAATNELGVFSISVFHRRQKIYLHGFYKSTETIPIVVRNESSRYYDNIM